MYDNVLVPTDGTEAVQPAVEHAIDLAETYEATLHVLYVIDERPYATPDVRANPMVETLESEGAQAVAAVRERAESAGVPVETTVTTGTPYQKILDYADERDIDIVVMGTRPARRGPLSAGQRHGVGGSVDRRARTDSSRSAADE